MLSRALVTLIYSYQKVSILIKISLPKKWRIRSFSGPYFPALGLNTERYSVSLHIQSECGKTLARKTPNMDTFHAMFSVNPQFDNFRLFHSSMILLVLLF